MSRHRMSLVWIGALRVNVNLLQLEWFTPYLTYFSPRLSIVCQREVAGLGHPFEGCRKKVCYPLQKGPHVGNLKWTHTYRYNSHSLTLSLRKYIFEQNNSITFLVRLDSPLMMTPIRSWQRLLAGKNLLNV